MLAIRLPAEIEQRLQELAQASGRTRSELAREAIVRFLDQQQDASGKIRPPHAVRKAQNLPVRLGTLMDHYQQTHQESDPE